MKGSEKMKYSYMFFKNGLPEWKRKKDTILVKLFYRPVSFYLASFAASLHISANTVSYFSALIAIISCLLYLFPMHVLHILAAILVSIWLLLDCTDGNLARSVKKLPFGEFADATSSYILVGFLCTCIGFSVYTYGGILFKKGNVWIMLMGALASSSDTMMRLIYQKYKNVEHGLIDAGVIKEENDIRTDINKVNSFRVRMEAELGIAGILPIALLLGSIFNALDLIVIYCFLYYGGSFVVCTLIYVRKAMKKAKEYGVKNNE